MTMVEFVELVLRKKDSLRQKDLFIRKVFSREWKDEGDMEVESGESTEEEQVTVRETGVLELGRDTRSWFHRPSHTQP